MSTINIELTSQMSMAIDGVLRTGLFGDTREEAARRLMERAIDNEMSNGNIGWKDLLPDSSSSSGFGAKSL